jgi:hypothetical protein
MRKGLAVTHLNFIYLLRCGSYLSTLPNFCSPLRKDAQSVPAEEGKEVEDGVKGKN